jgi:hypothetical protein
MELLLLSLILVLGAAFAIFAAENGTDSRGFDADTYGPHTGGLN